MGLKSLVSIMATCKNVRIISSILPTLLFFFLLLELSTAQAAIPQSEREALISLYNATNGDDWTNSDGWTGATPQRAAARLKQQAMFTLTWLRAPSYTLC